jgi:hypothetical protein
LWPIKLSALSVGTFHLSINAQDLAEVNTDPVLGQRLWSENSGRIAEDIHSGLRLARCLHAASINKSPTVLTPRRNHIVQMRPDAGGRRIPLASPPVAQGLASIRCRSVNCHADGGMVKVIVWWSSPMEGYHEIAYGSLFDRDVVHLARFTAARSGTTARSESPKCKATNAATSVGQ